MGYLGNFHALDQVNLGRTEDVISKLPGVSNKKHLRVVSASNKLNNPIHAEKNDANTKKGQSCLKNNDNYLIYPEELRQTYCERIAKLNGYKIPKG